MLELSGTDEKKGPSHSLDFPEAKTVVAIGSPLVLLLHFILGETEAQRVNLPKIRELGRGRKKIIIPVIRCLLGTSHSGETVKSAWDAR